MILGLISTGLGVSILPGSYAFSAPPNVRFINLPYKVMHVAGRKEDKSPIIKNVLQQVQETALKYGLEEN